VDCADKFDIVIDISLRNCLLKNIHNDFSETYSDFFLKQFTIQMKQNTQIMRNFTKTSKKQKNILIPITTGKKAAKALPYFSQ
jgi:hypothetical protein